MGLLVSIFGLRIAIQADKGVTLGDIVDTLPGEAVAKNLFGGTVEAVVRIDAEVRLVLLLVFDDLEPGQDFPEITLLHPVEGIPVVDEGEDIVG